MSDFDTEVRDALQAQVRQLEAENAHLREAIDALQRAAAVKKPKRRKPVTKRTRRTRGVTRRR
jgi:exonuclease VII small subunit